MVTHVVIFTWSPGVTPGQVAGFGEALEEMARRLAAPPVIRHGPDLAFRGGNGDYALIAEFPDRAAWDAYQADPGHKAFVRDVVSPMQASRVAIQF